MTIDLPFNELAAFAAILVATGFVVGLLASLFGVGGGAISVPVLHHFLGQVGVSEVVRMHVSVGTSLAIIVPTAIASFLGHYRRGAVDMGILRSWLIPIPLAAIAASLAAAYISGTALRLIFAAIAALLGLRLIIGKDRFKLGGALPGPVGRGVAGLLIGLFSTWMGVGGGIMSNAFLTFFGTPMIRAVATSSGVGVLIAIPATIGYIASGWNVAGLPPYSLGFVNLVGVLLIIPVAMLATPLGVAIAHRLPSRMLELGFGLFLLFVAGNFAVSLL